MALAMAACGDASQDLSGQYQDQESQRASMGLVKNDDGVYNITISWADSANEGMYWIASGEFDGDKIEYTDCQCHKYKYNDKGEIVQDKVLEKDEKGTLIQKDENTLEWKGAKDNEKASFVKIELED